MLKCTGVANLQTDNQSGLNGEEVFVSLFVRVRSFLADGSVILLKLGNSNIKVYPWNSRTELFFESSISFDEGGGAGCFSGLAALGVLHHVCFSYSKTTSALRRMWVNGNPATFGPDESKTVAVTSSETWIGQGDPTEMDVEIQDVLVVTGYAGDEDDVAAIRADPTTAWETIGAVIPGVTRAYYSCNGPEGDPAEGGDPGITAQPAGDSARDFGSPLSGTVVYAPRAVYGTQIAQVVIGSEGVSFDVKVVDADTGTVLKLYPDHDFPGAVTLTIDGGEPIECTHALTVYDGEWDGYIGFLPDGERVPEGATVLVHFPPGYFAAGAGETPEYVDFPAVNNSGKPMITGDWTPRLPVGINVSSTSGPDDSVPAPIMANEAYGMYLNGYWCKPNGTSEFNYDVDCFRRTYREKVTKSGAQNVTGPYLLELWDDEYESSFRLKPQHPSAKCTLLDGYTTDDGVYHARVIDVQNNVVPLTLSAAIDDATTTIPLDGDFTTVAGPDDSSDTYLLVGTEKIKVGAISYDPKQATGCTRGWAGTSAVSHAEDDEVEYRYTRKDWHLKLEITHESGSLSYSKVRLRSNRNCTIPETPGPITPDAWDPYALDADFQDIAVDSGAECIRPMDCMAPFRAISEVEWIVDLNDPAWQSNKKTDHFEFVGAEPMDMEVYPYAYDHREIPGYERYDGTLAADMPDAEPGEETDITINDAEICDDGQPIIIGGEEMKIVGLSDTGFGTHRVKRGRCGTTPTAHSAGATASIGWRRSITHVAQYLPGESVYAAGVLKIDVEASSLPRSGFPHSAGKTPPGVYAVDGIAAGRATVALGTTIDADDVTFTLTYDPEDADKIIANAELVIGSEVMQVYDARSLPTVTVRARSGGSSHTAGASVTVRAPAGAVRYEGGREGVPDTYPFYGQAYWFGTVFITVARDAVLVLTSRDATLPDPDTKQARMMASQTFVPGAYKTGQEIHPQAMYPYEFLAEMVNKAPGRVRLWICQPYLASKDFHWETTGGLLSHIKADSELIFEPSNECWNENFLQSLWPRVYTQLSYGPDAVHPADDYVTTGGKMAEIAKACAATFGREADVKFVLCWQQGGVTGLAQQCHRLNVYPDAVGAAPYINPKDSPALRAWYGANSPDRCIAMWKHHMLHGNETRDNLADLVRACDYMEDQTGVRPHNWHYEGWFGSRLPLDTSGAYPAIATDIDQGWERAADMWNSPFMRHLFYDIANRYFFGGCRLSCIFTYAYVSEQPYGFAWGVVEYPNRRRGRGDGIGGAADNSQCTYLDGPNKHGELASPAEVNDGVVANAYKEYQAARQAALNPEASPSFRLVGVDRVKKGSVLDSKGSAGIYCLRNDQTVYDATPPYILSISDNSINDPFTAQDNQALANADPQWFELPDGNRTSSQKYRSGGANMEITVLVDEEDADVHLVSVYSSLNVDGRMLKFAIADLDGNIYAETEMMSYGNGEPLWATFAYRGSFKLVLSADFNPFYSAILFDRATPDIAGSVPDYAFGDFAMVV